MKHFSLSGVIWKKCNLSIYWNALYFSRKMSTCFFSKIKKKIFFFFFCLFFAINRDYCKFWCGYNRSKLMVGSLTSNLIQRMQRSAVKNKRKFLVRSFFLDLVITKQSILAIDYWIQQFICSTEEESSTLCFGWKGELLNKKKQKLKHKKQIKQQNKKPYVKFEIVRHYYFDYPINIL